MTPKEAYARLCEHLKQKVYVVGCREYDKFYGFYYVKKKNEGRVFVGGSMTLVNKKDGEVFSEDDLPRPIDPTKQWKSVDVSKF